MTEQVRLPYSVGLANTSGSLLARFATEKDAAAFIELLPDHLAGKYYLDGEEVDGELLRLQRAIALVERIADYTLDGEEVDGAPYEQSIDDAFDVCSEFIRSARAIAWPLG